MQEPGVTIIDARESSYFIQGHIPRARNYTLEQIALEASLTNSPLARARMLVLYKAGKFGELNSTAATVISRGFGDRLVVFSGGWREWIECGLPVERGH
jgi:rhodanese-related sulfurtransferase